MKKLFRQEWKYYLIFLVVVIYILYSHCRGGVVTSMPISDAWGKEEITYMVLLNLGEYMSWYWYDSLYVIFIIVISVFLLKGGFFLLEKDSYGREFLQTLPIKRADRMCFHLIMDSLFIVISTAFSGVLLWQQMEKYLKKEVIELPWLGKAMFGVAVTEICYLLFLLAVINVLECIFVNGLTRIVGIVACLGMSCTVLNWLLEKYGGSVVVQRIVGFLVWGEDFSYGQWDGKLHVYEIIYQGKRLEFVSGGGWQSKNGFFETGMMHLNRLYDCSKLEACGFPILVYIVLTILLVGLSVWLFGKQEVSRQGLYFGYGKYILGALTGMSVLVFLNVNSSAVWYGGLSVVAAVFVFLLVLYRLSIYKKCGYDSTAK